MHYRRLFHFALTPALALSLTCLAPALASAEGEDAAEPKRVRIRISRPKPQGSSALHEHDRDAPESATPKKDPMQTVMRWAMGEMGAELSGAGGEASAHLKKWFEGGADVPAAGLRDALKADGWTAASLQQWFSRHLMSSAPRMMRLLSLGGGEGESASLHTLFDHNFHASAPRGAHGQGHGHADCPLCGSQDRGRLGHGMRRGMHGGMQHSMRGPGRRSWHGRGGRRGPGSWHGQGRGRGGRHGAGPMGAWGPQAKMQSRTVILWNDGNGWHRKEVPGAAMGGRRRGPHGMNPGNMGPHGQGRQGRGPGAGSGPHGMGPGSGMGPHGQGHQGRGPGAGFGPRGMGSGSGMGPHGQGRQGRGPGAGFGPHGMGSGSGMGPHGQGRQGRGPGAGFGPRGMGSGSGMGPHGQGRQGRGPGAGFGPHGMGPRSGVGPRGVRGGGMGGRKRGMGMPGAKPQVEMPWMKFLQEMGSEEGKFDLKAIRKFLEQIGVDQRGAGEPKNGIRVKLIKGSDDSGAEIVIQKEIIEKKPAR